jgi:KDO2-lipid IV(A) lauroyltransferase
MYYIIYGLLYLVSLLPWFVLYGISDILSFIVLRFVGYRKQIVLGNLAIAFPEKTEAERNRIARRFYRNFSDTIVETIKLLSASNKAVDRRFAGDIGVLKMIGNLGHQVQVHAMHNFNWEILNLALAKHLPKPLLCVYMPLANRHMERITSQIRSRYGTILVPAIDFKTNFVRYENTPYLLALVADQNPSNPKNAWWANFFGKPAPFVRGPEKAARMKKLPVVFGHFYQARRGVYTFDMEIATHDASTLQEGELTLAFIRYVEKCIRKKPDNYLWSHRRWKHAYKPEYAELALEKLNL